MKVNEAAFVSRGQTLASAYHAYLGMSLYVILGGNPTHFENNLVLIGPDGKVAWIYQKTRPVPGQKLP